MDLAHNDKSELAWTSKNDWILYLISENIQNGTYQNAIPSNVFVEKITVISTNAMFKFAAVTIVTTNMLV